MNEFIEKLIGRLEEQIKIEESIAKSETEGHPITHQYASNCLKLFRNQVNQLAEEYNNGWIPVNSGRLPEESGEYYTYVYYDGHYMYSIDEIDCDAIVKEWNCSSDYKIIAWKPITPYQPKGE